MRALRSLLADWPASIPAAVLVVQHPGNGGGRFAEVLDHSTELEVVAEVERATGVPVAVILEGLGLPAGTDPEEHLGRLRREHGFEIDDVRAMDDLERAVFFKRVYNDPSIRAEGVDAEGLIIKFEKSLASGGFNPESTDLDIVIVATEKLVGKFDSDTRFGRDIFAGRSEVPDGYFSARAIGDYSKPSYKHLENKAALELEATVKGSELEAARQAFNDQIFFSAFLGKAL